MQTPALVGRRYLVLEDDYLIASALADLLVSQGAEVCGPVSNLVDAAAALKGEGDLDGALLDIDVHGQTSYGIFDALEQRGVPCLFVTALSVERIPAAYAHVPRLEKPMGGGAVVAALQELSTGPARA
ncbi:response regulator [Luteibacter aegosomatissinici]|uniref:response regulator n=1 Tax=Luteibacter aegosomatissinici TaxID=2911539 RepID=UPI001FF9D224|nr:response regulator [Luteibacter aegosomatissinici]UPG96578.1 response regulator [Luteibacter aegosomatissinici]